MSPKRVIFFSANFTPIVKFSLLERQITSKIIFFE